MKPVLIATLTCMLSGSASPILAQMSVALTATSARVPVGTPIGWNAQIDAGDMDGLDASTVWYRYRVHRFGQDYQMVRDFGPRQDLLWAGSDSEGTYEIELTARNIATGESVVQTALFEVTPLTTSAPAITPTSHPLVFLYSAGGCAGGSRMRAEIQAPNGDVQTTPYKPCQLGLSTNFQLAGLQPNTSYQVHHTIDTGAAFADGPALTFTTGAVPVKLAPYTVVKTPPQASSGVLLQSTLFEQTVATDLNGNLIWYYPSGDISFLTRPESGGRFLGILQDSTQGPDHQVLREFDLVGNSLQETNAARINEQLAAMNKRLINGFHHEAIRLPDGNILTLAATEQILTDVQGPGPVDVLGDMILVLDKDLQVVWAWDAFDHLDSTRLATLNETCGPASAGCPPVYSAAQANDWLHGNALQLTPDGNILYSIRHQDWVVKIDYHNGAGGGNILWRLGKDGDFTYNSTDPYPWFSHQHDPNIEAADNSLLDVFDNGNVRNAADNSADSRGQVIKLDEQSHTAALVLNADLGAYSLAVGSAQRLPNGDHHFDLGFVNDPSQGPSSESVEVDPSGNIVYQIQTGTPAYRTFRMRSLYAPN